MQNILNSITRRCTDFLTATVATSEKHDNGTPHGEKMRKKGFLNYTVVGVLEVTNKIKINWMCVPAQGKN